MELLSEMMSSIRDVDGELCVFLHEEVVTKKILVDKVKYFFYECEHYLLNMII